MVGGFLAGHVLDQLFYFPQETPPQERWDLLSYLAFDGEYTSRLLALGYSDVRARGAEIAAFLGGCDAESKAPHR